MSYLGLYWPEHPPSYLISETKQGQAFLVHGWEINGCYISVLGISYVSVTMVSKHCGIQGAFRVLSVWGGRRMVWWDCVCISIPSDVDDNISVPYSCEYKFMNVSKVL